MSEIAQNGYVALGVQAAKGTPAAVTGSDALRITSFGVSGRSDRLDDEDEIGGGRDYDTSGATLGGFSVSGDVEGLFRPKTFGLLLLAAGFAAAAPVQDGATGAWTHVFTPSSVFKYLTLATRWGLTDAVRVISDALVDSFSFSLDANGKVTWSASFIGRTESYGGAAVTPTYETAPIANYGGSAVTFDGLGTYKFESLGFSVANNMSDDEYVIGSRILDDMTPGAREVGMSGDIKVGANSPSITDLYRAATYGSKTATGPGGSDPYHTAAALTFGSTKKVGTSITKFYGLTATIPDMVLNGFPLEASGADRLMASIEAKAYKGAGQVVTLDLVNDRATQYA